MSYDYYYTDDIEKEIKNLNNENKRPDNYGLAVTALVLGIVSLVFFLFFINIFTALAAIVMGIIYLASAGKKARGKGLAIAGIITSILSIVLCIGGYVIIFSNRDKIPDMFPNELENNNPYYDYYDDGEDVDPFRDFDGFDGFEGFGDFDDFYNDFNGNQNGLDGLDDYNGIDALPGQGDDTL